MSNSLPLEGIRIMDMTVVWAGPYTTSLLADMGAQIIRVENIQFAPYGTRGFILRPPRALLESGGLLMAGYPNREAGERPWNRTAFFNVHARNKLAMTVDHFQPKGMEILKKLVKISDVFVENNAYGLVERLGLGYDELKKINPDIIMISMPGFGNSGPYKERSVLGRHLGGLSGDTMLRGYPDSDPTTTTDVYHCDATAGAMGALSALIALHHRERTGKGQFIDLAQIETMIPQLGEAFMDYTMNGRIQKSLGNGHPWAAPSNLYPCQGDDRWIAITVTSDDEWQALRRIMGNPSWAADDKFSDNLSRWQNREELDSNLSDWTRGQNDFELMRFLQGEGIAAGPSLDERDCYADPHINDRGFFEEVTQEDCGTHLYPGMMWKMSKTPSKINQPPCMVGEHNEYIYKELLGVSDEEYAELEREGHIGMEYHPSISVRGRAKS